MLASMPRLVGHALRGSGAPTIGITCQQTNCCDAITCAYHLESMTDFHLGSLAQDPCFRLTMQPSLMRPIWTCGAEARQEHSGKRELNRPGQKMSGQSRRRGAWQMQLQSGGNKLYVHSP